MVPASRASGRSVTVRITSTGFPSEGASSCMPPLSVTIIYELFIMNTNGRYSSGSIKNTLSNALSENISAIGRRTFGFKCMGYTKSVSGNASAISRIARHTLSMPSPKFSRRWPVNSTIRRLPSSLDTSYPADTIASHAFSLSSGRVSKASVTMLSASITVLPVTVILESSTDSARRLRALASVGEKCHVAMRPVSLRFISSGQGEYMSPVRSPAST